MGTRSVLQRFNQDLSTQLDEWTYSSVHHFYESSAGIWTVEVADERPGITGRLLSVELSILGVRIADADRDGLDDSWETIWLAGLAYGPKDDPDNDGLSNAREQLLNTDPLRPDSSPEIDISRWDANLVRLSWPAMPAMDYAVYATSELGKPAGVLTNIPGQFPETEWLTSSTNLSEQFFRVDSHPRR
jgi:hypothetical protein